MHPTNRENASTPFAAQILRRSPILAAALLALATTGCASKEVASPEPPTEVAAQSPAQPQSLEAELSGEAQIEQGTPPAPPARPSPAQPASLAPPAIVQADAIAIVERARELLADVRSLACETMTEATGAAAAQAQFSLGVRHRVELRFERRDAVSVPLFRIARVDSADGGDVLGPTSIYDGTRAIIVDDRARTFLDPGRDWVRVAGPVIPALPQWFLRERARAAQLAQGAPPARPGPLEPEVIGARVVAVEDLDGVECDVVELYFIRSLVAMSDEDGSLEVIDEQRYTETTHFARVDGMPRRIVTREIPEAGAAEGAESSLTVHFRGLSVNPDFGPSHFLAAPPAGYTPSAAR